MHQKSENLETLTAGVGGLGRYQVTVILLFGLGCYSNLGFNHVIMAYHGSPVAHKCRAGVDVMLGPNSTEEHSVSPYVTNVSHSQCSSTLTYSDGEEKVIECTSGQWEYFPEYGERNIVSEFDLVCSNEYLTSLATTIYFTGVMVGGLVFGDLADRFGRLPVALCTLYTSVVVGLISAFSVNYTMFVCLRFVIGFLMQGLQNSVYTLAVELVRPQDRPFAAMTIETFFGVAIMTLAGLAYGLRNWRHLQLVVALLPLVTPLFTWALPESTRWLVMKGKTKRAEKQLKRIYKVNKVPFPVECWGLLKDTRGSQTLGKQQYNVTHLFRSWSIGKIVVIASYSWFVISATYYGLTFKITSLKGSPYFNFFISGLCETAVCTVSIPLMNRFGRKRPLIIGYILNATMCLTAGFIDTFSTGQEHVTTAFGLVGKIATSFLFVVFYMYSSELFPTVVRTAALGVCMFCARFGSLLAPQLNQWTRILLGFDVIYLFGALSLIGGLIVLPLPETHRQRLPDRIEEKISPQNGGQANLEITDVIMASKAGVDDVTAHMLGNNPIKSERV